MAKPSDFLELTKKGLNLLTQAALAQENSEKAKPAIAWIIGLLEHVLGSPLGGLHVPKSIGEAVKAYGSALAASTQSGQLQPVLVADRPHAQYGNVPLGDYRS